MKQSTDILPVIICGGAGSRLWPLSRKSEPKQFATLVGETSLFQETLKRFKGDAFLPPAIICNGAHAETVQAQAEAVGIVLGPIVLEPVGRNTAACGVVAAMLGTQNQEAKSVLMVPADHHITRPDVFASRVLSAKALAEAGNLVTFGITPTGPHTGFGYIEGGADNGVGFHVLKFHEKPSRDRALEYVESGSFFWNAGIFMFSPDALLQEFAEHAADVAEAVETAAMPHGTGIAIDADAFADVPDISFDYAIAERTRRAVVVAADMGWSDIGSYSALFDLRASLEQAATPATSIVKAGQGVHIDSDDPDIIVTVAGLDNVGVILRAGRLLVVGLDKDQDVKSVVQALPQDRR